MNAIQCQRDFEFLIFKENKMYFDQIKAELVEAQDVLNKFVSDDNNNQTH